MPALLCRASGMPAGRHRWGRQRLGVTLLCDCQDTRACKVLTEIYGPEPSNELHRSLAERES